MSLIRVDTGAGSLTFGDIAMPCTIGRSGACAAVDKREGDGCTPLGVWPIRGALLRPGKVQAAGVRLPWRWLREGDGWSDDVGDPAYNRPVHLPRAFSAENLLRPDDAYDVIVVLGHNDAPPVPGRAMRWKLSDRESDTPPRRAGALRHAGSNSATSPPAASSNRRSSVCNRALLSIFPPSRSVT
jgi:L,D-peptidoglycan transpeptidase YkuD (ErfK/YbiS/YcfS/YnhG family)